MARTAISPALHEEMTEKLEQLLDDQDDVHEKKQRISKALGGELKIIAGAIARTRRILKGVESPQEDLPGLEGGERQRDPAVLQILRAAERVAVREAEEEPAAPDAEKCLDCGKDAAQPSPGCDSCDHGRVSPDKLVGTREVAVPKARPAKGPLSRKRGRRG